MTEGNNKFNSEVVDLQLVYNKFSKSIKSNIFDLIIFLKKYSLLIVSILVISVILGYFLDKRSQSFKSEIYIKANFENVDYLYSKIDALNSKLINKDEKYIKTNNLSLNKVIKVDIKPIEDAFLFIKEKDDKAFELLKLFTEENDISKVLADKKFYKNYLNHTIIITSHESIDSKKVNESIINFINKNDYYSQLKTLVNTNNKEKINQNNMMIEQIDKIVNNTDSNKPSTNLLMVGENTQLSDLLEMKDKLISENQSLTISLANNSSIFKVISNDIENVRLTNHFYIYILPLFIFFIFIIIILLKTINRRISDEK